MTNVRSILLASAASLAVAGLAAPTAALAADQLLSGAISSPSGEKLAGVTVSAKQEGTTITTSVYTDESGNYYFPPLATGKYSRHCAVPSKSGSSATSHDKRRISVGPKLRRA